MWNHITNNYQFTNIKFTDVIIFLSFIEEQKKLKKLEKLVEKANEEEEKTQNNNSQP